MNMSLQNHSKFYIYFRQTNLGYHNYQEYQNYNCQMGQNYGNDNFPQKHKFIKQNLNYENMDNSELLNYVSILGKDQAGCRMLQKRIHLDSNYAVQVYLKVERKLI